MNIHQVDSGCDIVDEMYIYKNKAPSHSDKTITKPNKETSTKGGQPSIVSKFPDIPEIVSEYIKRNGYKAQERRRTNDFESCGVSVSDVRRHILDTVPGLKQYGISLSTVRYLFNPVNRWRKHSSRYKSLVKCSVPKKDNSLRKDTKNAHYIHCRVAMRLEHASRFSEDYVVVSADAMNKVHVGTLAVSRYTC